MDLVTLIQTFASRRASLPVYPKGAPKREACELEREEMEVSRALFTRLTRGEMDVLLCIVSDLSELREMEEKAEAA
jgi:hypothetical protein